MRFSILKVISKNQEYLLKEIWQMGGANFYCYMLPQKTKKQKKFSLLLLFKIVISVHD